MTFRYAPGARGDVFDLADWFDAQTPGIGIQVVQEVQLAIDRILITPSGYSSVRRQPKGREIRAVKIDRFNAVIVYEVLIGAIVILSVTHGRRIRQAWRRRVSAPPSP